ncbi:MAG: hypothetical protein NT079_06940 [Candidatus Omnitrophica bacterium]|nr:hypothetical protein [Candidatus Omnitrophota bacterium]
MYKFFVLHRQGNSLFRPIFLIAVLLIISASFAAGQQDAAFLNSINDEGEGTNFDQPVLLNDRCDFSKCETDECAKKVFQETIFKQELEYVANKFGRPDIDWQLTGETPVAAYIDTVGRYYDDLSIQITEMGKSQTLHFDITSSMDALKQKEYGFQDLP